MSWKSYIKRLIRPQKTLVLMYHRIASPSADPWQLAVSPENFEAQLKLLKRKYTVVTPQQLWKKTSFSFGRKHRICLTFDDGYLDNFLVAKPLLEKHGCPATFFITTYSLQTGQPFWWDELQEIIFSTARLPSQFNFLINGETISEELENSGTLTNSQLEKQANWIWFQPPPTARCRIYFRLWEKMRPLPQREIEPLLKELKKKCNIDSVDMHGAKPMTLANLKEMSQSPFIQIGLHTHTHPNLAEHPANVQQNELGENKKILEETCGYAMKVLSYPHGKYNADTLFALRQLQVEIAFTTTSGLVKSTDDAHQLGRYQVVNSDGETFAAFLKNLMG